MPADSPSSLIPGKVAVVREHVGRPIHTGGFIPPIGASWNQDQRVGMSMRLLLGHCARSPGSVYAHRGEEPAECSAQLSALPSTIRREQFAVVGGRVKASVAITELEKLREEAEEPQVVVGETFTAWKARGKSLLIMAFSPTHHLVESFDKVGYSLTVLTTNTPRSAYTDARRQGIRKACGLLRAAVYELSLQDGDDAGPADGSGYDPELWEHVRGLVANEDWGKIPGVVATFVENHLRTWAKDPKNKDGGNLVGQGLFAQVLSPDDTNPLRLGQQRSESEGWQKLGMGFTQALSNVDRHRIQKRDDAKQYAVGVLGLGSLLLTQLRYEHGDLLNEH